MVMCSTHTHVGVAARPVDLCDPMMHTNVHTVMRRGESVGHSA